MGVGMKRLVLVGLVVLAGCQNGGIGMAESPAWFMTATPQEQATYFGKRCSTYGFKPGTPEMAQCIMTEAGSARSSARTRAALAQHAMANSQPRMVTTNCNRFGSSVTCTSY